MSAWGFSFLALWLPFTELIPSTHIHTTHTAQNSAQPAYPFLYHLVIFPFPSLKPISQLPPYHLGSRLAFLFMEGEKTLYLGKPPSSLTNMQGLHFIPEFLSRLTFLMFNLIMDKSLARNNVQLSFKHFNYNSLSFHSHFSYCLQQKKHLPSTTDSFV